MDGEQQHRPVLLDEVVEGLAPRDGGLYLDATYGRGGHATALLERIGATGRLLVVDRDPQAITEARRRHGDDGRVVIEQAAFADAPEVVKRLGWHGRLDGILVDLGVSSPQLDDSQRGFSFRQDGPLDMRMDPSHGEPVSGWLARVEEAELIEVLREFGEERHARRIARAVLKARASEPLTTTGQLAEVVRRAHPDWRKGHDPATRTFQALRIRINGELDQLADFLAQATDLLAIGGRLAVISFHSLEDRMVKRFMRGDAEREELPAWLPLLPSESHHRLKPFGRARRAGSVELAVNPRARSAVLRLACKVAA